MIRDFLLGSVQLHILQHAAQEPVFGLALLRKLRQRGYEISPGTLYPQLHRLVDRGYLTRAEALVQGKIRKYYAITDAGRRALQEAGPKISELVAELLEGSRLVSEHGPGTAPATNAAGREHEHERSEGWSSTTSRTRSAQSKTTASLCSSWSPSRTYRGGRKHSTSWSGSTPS